MDFKGRISLLDLFNEPFNVIHELYRLVFLKQQAMLEKEAEEKRKAEEEQKRQLEEERQAKRNNVPLAFAANHSRNTPPKQDKTSSLANQVTASDLEDFIEEVTS